MRASKLKINDVYTDEYGISPKGRVEVPTPEQDVVHTEVKGRHGSLTKKYGFKDILLPVHFTMYGESFKKIFREVKMKLLDAKTLVFDDDDEVHYKVKNVQIVTAENLIKKFGEFTVMFTLAPFQYELNDSTKTITGRTMLSNQGYESEPLITVHCAGTGKLYVNNVPITIQNINGTIIIDSELMNAYSNNNGIITNLNNHMIGDFPVFKHGSNVIYFDGGITKLEVNPRWRWV